MQTSEQTVYSWLSKGLDGNLNLMQKMVEEKVAPDETRLSELHALHDKLTDILVAGDQLAQTQLKLVTKTSERVASNVKRKPKRR